jgi:hypothetical protein
VVNCERQENMQPCLRFKLKLSGPTIHHEGACGERGVQFLPILDLGTRWGEWSASRSGRALPPGKGPLIPIVQEAGWFSELVLTQRLDEKFFCLCRGSNVARQVLHFIPKHYTY